MECGQKICIGISPFSQIYISEMLHDEIKVHRSSNILEVILFLGKHKTEYVGLYFFRKIHDKDRPKSDEVTMKHNHLLIYHPYGLNLYITAHGDLTTVHFAIPMDVYEHFFKNETPSRDQKWACYNKSLEMNIK